MSESPITPDRTAKTASNPRGRWRRLVVRVMLVLLLATVGNVGFVVVRWFGIAKDLWPLELQAGIGRYHDPSGRGLDWTGSRALGVTLIDWYPDNTFLRESDNIDFFDELAYAQPDLRIVDEPWVRPRRESDFSLRPRRARCSEQAFGWPMRCLHAQASWIDDSVAVGGGTRVRVQDYRVDFGARVLFLAPNQSELLVPVLPTHILWPGMLANTLVWSAMVMTPWVMWRGLVMIRSRRRIARGRCGACGYDRRGIEAGAACPECGRSVRSG